MTPSAPDRKTAPTPAPDAARASFDQAVPTPPRRRFGRREAPRSDGAGAGGESLQAVLAEVVLLREENARLKAAQHQPASLGRIVGQARSLPAAHHAAEELADDAAHMLIEGMVLRESLLEVCHELERAMVSVKTRLEALSTEPKPGAEPTATRRPATAAGGSNGLGNGGRPNGSANGHGANDRARKGGQGANGRARKGSANGSGARNGTRRTHEGGTDGSGDA
jgi:hypothetical protein